MFGGLAVTETLIGLKHEEPAPARAIGRAGRGWDEIPQAAGQPVLAAMTGVAASLAATAGAAGRALGRTIQRTVIRGGARHAA